MIGNRESAIKRIELINKHFNPSEDFNRELNSSSFNFDLATSVLRGLRPDKVHQVVQLVEPMIKEGYRREIARDVHRGELNKFCKEILDKILEKGIFTLEEIVQDIDLFNRCTMSL